MDEIPVRRKEKWWKMFHIFRATAGQKAGSKGRLTQKGAVLRSRLKIHEKNLWLEGWKINLGNNTEWEKRLWPWIGLKNEKVKSQLSATWMILLLWSRKTSHWTHTYPPASSVTLAVHSFLLCRPALSSDFVSKLKGLHFCLERRHSTYDLDEIRITQTHKPGKSWYFLGFTCHHCWKLGLSPFLHTPWAV